MAQAAWIDIVKHGKLEMLEALAAAIVERTGRGVQALLYQPGCAVLAWQTSVEDMPVLFCLRRDSVGAALLVRADALVVLVVLVEPAYHKYRFPNRHSGSRWPRRRPHLLAMYSVRQHGRRADGRLLDGVQGHCAVGGE